MHTFSMDEVTDKVHDKQATNEIGRGIRRTGLQIADARSSVTNIRTDGRSSSKN